MDRWTKHVELASCVPVLSPGTNFLSTSVVNNFNGFKSAL